MSELAPLQQNSTALEPSLNDLLNLLKKEIFYDLNCHHIATIRSFDPAKQTVTATINYTRTIFQISQSSGLYVPVQINYPLLLDVPAIVLGGGTANLTLPITSGDQCLVLFNDRSLDVWFNSGQTGPVQNSRAHSFSDGIALVGLRPATNPIENYDSTRAVLRNGTTGVGVSSSAVKIFNESTTLNTVLQNILTQLETLANSVCVPGSPLNPAVATQLASLATQLGGLIE